jgi:DNA segregation ATPase FtsK/SpoIIIE-like protein
MKPSEWLKSKGWAKEHEGRMAYLSDWKDPVTGKPELFLDAVRIQADREEGEAAIKDPRPWKPEPKDPLLEEAKEVCRKHGYATVSHIQRMMRIGYTRAARLVDYMIEDGFIKADVEFETGRRLLIE